jgi:hypothetical protein
VKRGKQLLEAVHAVGVQHEAHGLTFEDKGWDVAALR